MVFHSASTVRSAASRSRRLSFQTARPIGFRWTVRRQIEQGRTAGLNCLAHAADLVRTEVVQHDHVAGRKRRREERLDIGQERRSVEHEGATRPEMRRPQRNVVVCQCPWGTGQTRPRPSVPASGGGHIRRGPGLIEEHQATWVERRL